MAIIKLVAPEGATEVSFNGDAYPVEGGHVRVPERAAEALEPHGFRRVEVRLDEEEIDVEAEAPQLDPATADKAELLAYMRAAGVAAPTGHMTLGALRRAVADHIAAQPKG